MREEILDRLKKLKELVGEIPDGFLEDVCDLGIWHKTYRGVHAKATEKTTRRASH